jgi:hypothetical protein
MANQESGGMKEGGKTLIYVVSKLQLQRLRLTLLKYVGAATGLNHRDRKEIE